MKNNDDKKMQRRRLTYQLITACVLAFVGVVLLFCGMFLPPSGEIHPSVLTAFGEILVFSSGLFGIDYSYKVKVLDHSSSASNKKEKDNIDDIEENNTDC